MFKKMLVLSVLAIIVMGVIAGCGQQTPTINTSTPAPSGLTIRGTVYNYTIDDAIGDPVAGAVVILSGASASFNAVTDARGEYTIQDVPDGYYTVTATAEGYQRSSGWGVSIKPSSGIPANGTITVRDIELYSNPVILSYTPIPNTVITATQSFTVVFNEVIDRSSFKPTLAALGIRTMVADGSNVGLTVSSTDNKTFVITPTQALISNETYRLAINSTVRDTAGFPLSTGGEQSMSNTQDYRVGTGTGLPGAPSDLAIVYIGPTTECDYTNVYDVPAIGLSWKSPTSGGPVSYYNVYVAYGSGGNYSLLATYVVDNLANLRIDSTIGHNIIFALYGDYASRDPVCTGGYPFINDVCRIKVVAVNGDGESATGAQISVRDTLGPQLGPAVSQTGWGTGDVLDNNKFLPALASTEAYFSFTEPVVSLGSAARYHVDTQEAASVELITTFAAGQLGGNLNGACSVVKATFSDPITTGTTASTEAGAAGDLSGNSSRADAGGAIN